MTEVSFALRQSNEKRTVFGMSNFVLVAASLVLLLSGFEQVILLVLGMSRNA